MKNCQATSPEPGIIIGRHAVAEALAAGQHLNQLWIADGLDRDALLDQIFQSARQRGVRYAIVPRVKIESAAPGAVHQGVLAWVAPMSLLSEEELLQQALSRDNDPVILLLDSIEDPQNIGAIIRTAVAGGVAGVLITQHHSAPVNHTVFKTSAGMLAHCPVARVTNLVQTMRRLKSAGFWIYGADSHRGVDYDAPDYRGKIALALGNENRGLRRLVSEQCDFLVKIPMQAPVESLNVSVSAALLIYKAREKRAT